jgi:hypothetical protein
MPRGKTAKSKRDWMEGGSGEREGALESAELTSEFGGYGFQIQVHIIFAIKSSIIFESRQIRMA